MDCAKRAEYLSIKNNEDISWF